MRILLAMITIAVTACVAEPRADEPQDHEAAATEAVMTEPAAAEARPEVTTVYECTLDGAWYATRAACAASCAGGTCFACGALCQN